MNDLLRRLRLQRIDGRSDHEAMRDAAAAIEVLEERVFQMDALRARVAELERAAYRRQEELESQLNTLTQMWNVCDGDRSALRARVAEAEKIAHHIWRGQMLPTPCHWLYEEIARVFPEVENGPAKYFEPFSTAAGLSGNKPAPPSTSGVEMAEKWFPTDKATLADVGDGYMLAFNDQWPEPRVRVGRFNYLHSYHPFQMVDGGYMDAEPTHLARLPNGPRTGPRRETGLPPNKSEVRK